MHKRAKSSLKQRVVRSNQLLESVAMSATQFGFEVASDKNDPYISNIYKIIEESANLVPKLYI